MGQIQSTSRRWDLEVLEGRVLLSVAYGAELQSEAVKGGGAPSAPVVKMELVALHELGHSLGLDHDASDAVSIMDPYYNAQYDIDYFLSGQDPAVAKLRQLYAKGGAAGWKDALDSVPGDGCVELTYSFVPDGTRMDKGTSTTFKAFDAQYGATATWQGIIAQQVQRWGQVSEGKLAFSQTSDDGSAFNTWGKVQNDPRFGDIRIGAHRFDGAGKVLAHAYYPPPNGQTAAGDLHLDVMENWDGTKSVTAPTTTEEKKTSDPETEEPSAMFVRRPVVTAQAAVKVGASLFADKADGVLGTERWAM
ncbi:MAG TPA: matrixin family metalloprotease [Tepidisphaeraceae bacterium]|nr:matrixin family metalloprotease [Tepidisphaeraceae bacterium]